MTASTTFLVLATVFFSNGQTDWKVRLPTAADKTLAYAAEELVTFVRESTGVTLPVASRAWPWRKTVRIALDESLGDGFRLETGWRTYRITGGRRGVLYGVYETLERFGDIIFFGDIRTHVPKKDAFVVPDRFRDAQQPAFLGRSTTWKEVRTNIVSRTRLRFNLHRRGTVGSGLGLSIVKNILVMHDAQFGVRSKVGSGSTFWFTLDTVDAPDVPDITNTTEQQG